MDDWWPITFGELFLNAKHSKIFGILNKLLIVVYQIIRQQLIIQLLYLLAEVNSVPGAESTNQLKPNGELNGEVENKLIGV